MPAETARSQRQGSRRPVVRIRYAATSDTAAKELPFVVGVMANLAGDGLSSLPTFRQREFEPVDRYRFDALFNLYRPTLHLRVPHVLGDEPSSELTVSLQFRSLDDFSPRGVALQTPELRRLVESRAQLRRQRDRLELESVDPVQSLEPLERQILELDQRIAALLDVILHHPKFQKLEASWRGVQYLVSQTPHIDPNDPREKPRVKVLVLCVGWNELDRDFRDRVEFDQSTLFRKVYDENFGTAGGEPIGLLIGDYTIRPQGSEEAAGVDDREILQDISHVAAAAFCPFVAGMSPQFLGVDTFADFEYRSQVDQVFGRLPNKIVWKSLREAEDSRFVGLAAPRVLLRPPWTTEYLPDAGTGGLFRYEEDAGAPDLRRLLWGHAGWAFGEIVIRSFLQGGWFADMTGVQPGEVTRGVVAGLPEVCFGTDRWGLQPKLPVDLSIDEEFGEALTRNGLLALCRSYGSSRPAFFAAPSIQAAKEFDEAAATANAWLSASLETMLCVGRFAHHVKMLGRDLLGSTQSHEELQTRLHNWMIQYVTDLPNPTPEQRAKRPLSAAQVIVQPETGRLGGFRCEMHLKPHFSLERMVASIRLRTVLSPASSPAAVA